MVFIFKGSFFKVRFYHIIGLVLLYIGVAVLVSVIINGTYCNYQNFIDVFNNLDGSGKNYITISSVGLYSNSYVIPSMEDVNFAFAGGLVGNGLAGLLISNDNLVIAYLVSIAFLLIGLALILFDLIKYLMSRSRPVKEKPVKEKTPKVKPVRQAEPEPEAPRMEQVPPREPVRPTPPPPPQRDYGQVPPPPRPQPTRPVYNDDDAPYYAPRQQYGYRKPKPYALAAKIMMMSFSAMTGLFALICLLTYIGNFVAVKSAYGGAGTSGYKLAFTFDEGAIFVGAFIGFLCVLAVIGLSIPKIISDVKFFKAKEGTRKVARRRSKSIMWLILLSSIILIGIVFVFCSKAFIPSAYSSYYDLGGGAIGTAVLMIFMLMFNVAEEIFVLSMLRLRPREPEYE